MAARRRRRGRFNRIRPDMGWWVDSGNQDFIYTEPNGTASIGGAVSIFQFDDITDDDSLITRDNSDWFIKRVLLDVFPTMSTGADSNNANDVARLYSLAIGSIDNDKLAEWVVNQSHALYGPDGYEMWARMYRMYVKPVYATWAPVVALEAANGQLVTGSLGSVNQYKASDSPWGLSSIIDDFQVSNSGLRPEQSVSIAYGAEPGPGGFDWDTGDSMSLQWHARILLQKRRAA